MKLPKILFCGDSPPGGAANYLLGVLGSITPNVTHVPPSKALTATTAKKSYDVILLSDYPAKLVSRSVEKTLLSQVKKGAGLMMIGGWASFSGPFGGWRGTQTEEFLPVKCLARDDRMNFPGGAHLTLEQKHPIVESIAFKNPPAICGLNDVRLKKNATTVVNVRKIVSAGANLTLDPVDHPLLVLNSDPSSRVAAYTSDFAPHWCGGLVDWGGRHQKLPVVPKMQIEVGVTYIQFVSNIIHWLAGRL